MTLRQSAQEVSEAPGCPWLYGMSKGHQGRWQAIQMPAGVFPDAITPDGRGGIWVTTGISPEHFYRYHAGRWTRYQVPSPRGYGNVVFGLAWIPGTRSQWGVGEADANIGTHTVATVARYQP